MPVRRSSSPVPPSSRSPGRPGWPSGSHCCSGSSAAPPGTCSTPANLHVPYPSFADLLWLAWYPLVGIGIFYLIRVRVPQFELHRWMDGIAVTLLVLAVGFALVIQPATEHKTVGVAGHVRGLPLSGARRAAHRRHPRRLRPVGMAARHHVDPDRSGHRQHVRRRRGLCHSGGRGPGGRVRQQLQLHLDGRCAAPGSGGLGPSSRRRRGSRDGRGDARDCAGPLRAGAGHRHSDLRHLQRGREERADRHHRGAGRGVRADHPDPAAAQGGTGKRHRRATTKTLRVPPCAPH